MANLTQLTHLDISQLAHAGDGVSGRARAAVFTRLMQDVLDAGSERVVDWSAQGHSRQTFGASKPQVWLTVQASVDLLMTCQSCLEPVEVTLQVDREFRFVADEEQALREDEDSEEDLLVNPHEFDVYALIEDELILSLPLVPRHGGCIAAYQATEEELAADSEASKPNPFAALATLKNNQ